MGELIQFAPYLEAQKLRDSVTALNDALRQSEVPDPEAFGWFPVAWAEDHVPCAYHHKTYYAEIGYVPGEPDLVYLTYGGNQALYEMTLPELALAVQTGTLPEALN